jgi:hypothetical protein
MRNDWQSAERHHARTQSRVEELELENDRLRAMQRLGIARALVSYHIGQYQACPSCGAGQWIVGRTLAECVRCHIVLPIALPSVVPKRQFISEPEA